MIDENLCRAELTPSDRARQTARRKAIYEELHPETVQHVAGAEAKHGRASDKLSFAAATAEATGRDTRTVPRVVLDELKLDAEGTSPLAWDITLDCRAEMIREDRA